MWLWPQLAGSYNSLIALCSCSLALLFEMLSLHLNNIDLFFPIKTGLNLNVQALCILYGEESSQHPWSSVQFRAPHYKRESNKGPWRWGRDWSTSLVRRGWDSWDCSGWRWGGLEGSHQYLQIPEERMQRGWRQTLCSGTLDVGLSNLLWVFLV